MFRTRRVPRHLLLSDSGGDHPWLRRLLALVLMLLVGFGLGILAGETTGARTGPCTGAEHSGFVVPGRPLPTSGLWLSRPE